MKTVTIDRISLSNWRSQNRVVDFAKKTTISGRNKEGKSTVFNAWLWLMLGVDEFDRTNYQLFDNTSEQTYENSKVAAVEGVISINGEQYTLRKEASVGWVRRRGGSSYERKGTDNYKFFIDGIERSATEYKNTISELFAPTDKLKIMLNIRYFLNMDWKEMRKQLECMVGEISISDFNGDYSEIENDLGKYAADALKLSYKSKMKPIKNSIDSLPIVIETMKNSLPDLNEIEEARKSIDESKAMISDIDAKITGAGDFAKPYIEKRNAELAEIGRLKEEYANSETAYMANFDEEVLKITKEIRDIDSYNADIYKANKKAESDRENARKELERMIFLLAGFKKRHEELTEQNKECKARVFEGGICAYCGQELPEDKLEEARKRFNEQKEKDHAYIVAQGKSNKECLERTLKGIEKLEAELEKPLDEIIPKSKTGLEAELGKLRDSFIPYDKTAEGAAKLAVIEEIQANLTVVPQQDNDRLLLEKRDLLNNIERQSKKLGLKDQYDIQMEKIKALQEELRGNSIELARLEGKIAKVEEYEREKADIISNRVNTLFDYVSIKMTDIDKSGNVVDTCIITDEQGVNATVANNASRILCGIHLAAGFQKFFGLSLPIFIDNFEALSENSIPEVEQQEIKLVVADCPFKVTFE